MGVSTSRQNRLLAHDVFHGAQTEGRREHVSSDRLAVCVDADGRIPVDHDDAVHVGRRELPGRGVDGIADVDRLDRGRHEGPDAPLDPPLAQHLEEVTSRQDADRQVSLRHDQAMEARPRKPPRRVFEGLVGPCGEGGRRHDQSDGARTAGFTGEEAHDVGRRDDACEAPARHHRRGRDRLALKEPHDIFDGGVDARRHGGGGHPIGYEEHVQVSSPATTSRLKGTCTWMFPPPWGGRTPPAGSGERCTPWSGRRGWRRPWCRPRARGHRCRRGCRP